MRAALILAAAFLAHAQAQVPADDSHTYEVASIKPSQGGGRASGPRTNAGGRLNVTNTTLKSLIEFAWDVRSYQISGGPPWLDSTSWDIIANPDHPVRPSLANVVYFRLMLRSLLTERFKLTVRLESKVLPVYALVAVKKGLKLNRSEDAADVSNVSLHMSNGQLVGRKIPLKIVAQMLSEHLGRPVIDDTGLAGAYDFKLEWTQDPTACRHFTVSDRRDAGVVSLVVPAIRGCQSEAAGIASHRVCAVWRIPDG